MTRELTAYEKAGVAANEAESALVAAWAEYDEAMIAHDAAHVRLGTAKQTADAARAEADRLAALEA